MLISRLKSSRLLEPLAAGVLLLAFWIGMLASLRNTSQTCDEGVHVSAGYTYWRFNDYRFDPDHGNLAQRVMALPLLFGSYKFPGMDSDFWRTAREWDLAWQWFYELGNDVDEMLRRGRAAAGLLGVVLGILVWRWSRQLFGAIGGMISLLLYVLSPSILANGALMTTDMAVTLLFLAATWAWWKMLHRLTVGRLIVSGLTMGALFISKMSAVLIVPIALTLLVARLINNAPLPVAFFGLKDLRSRASRALAFIVAIIAHTIILLIVIWASYGFRYSAFSPQMPEGRWTSETWEKVLGKPVPRNLLDQITLSPAQREQVDQIFTRDRADKKTWSVASLRALDDIRAGVLTKEQAVRLQQLLEAPPAGFVPRVLETLSHYRLLPEAYIYGFASTWHGSLERPAFLNGEFSLVGWRTFFPYTFLVKTPLPVFLIIVIAIAAVAHRLRREDGLSRFVEGFYETLPLWVLLAVYWTAAISSNINIGHRHILPTYPPLFILCGAAGYWFEVPIPNRRTSRPRYSLARLACGVLALAFLVLATEIAHRFPHYLAYFNGIVTPAEAYRHLVDSSLDWGQDLPQVRDYVESKNPARPVYLSYFGVSSPAYYQTPAVLGYSFSNRYRRAPVQTLAFPADQADALLYDFFRREPEYDERLFEKGRQGDKVLVAVVKKASALRLTAGTYIVSATLLQPVTRPQRGAFGPWNERLEKQYQMAVLSIKPLLSDNPEERRTALKQQTPQKWALIINTYEYLRFHRLAAFLRHRQPDDNIGYSMLVYHLTDSDLSTALDGPPPELGRDILQESLGAAANSGDDTSQKSE
jgi:4-amino-4-deoxy-L-arabinose transferase-like glycosyltransferase